MLTFDLSTGATGRFIPVAEDLELDPNVFSELK